MDDSSGQYNIDHEQPRHLIGRLKLRAHKSSMDDANKIDKQKAQFNAALIRVAENRDKQAFRELYDYFAPRLKSFVKGAGVEDLAAEEIAQETMLIVWRRASLFDCTKAAASTWIFTIARNKRIDFQRKNNKPALSEHEFIHMEKDAVSQDIELEIDESNKALSDKIKGLPANQKEVIEKAFMEEKSHAVVAEELNLPLGTVKSRIRLALQRLKGQLKEFSPQVKSD